jgi:hypothetical protein
MNQQQKINIAVRQEDLKGNYSNTVQLTHTKEEFFLDFLLIYPPAGQLVQRIIINPLHAKRLQKALQENIEKYEARFGKLENTSAQEQEDIGFKIK